MRVSVEIPEPKAGLDGAVTKQFADMQRQLLTLVKEQSASKQQFQTVFVDSLATQQTAFLKALERLVGLVQTADHDETSSDALLTSLRGLKQTLAALPGDLKEALDRQYQHVQKSLSPATTSHVTVALPTGLTHRLDALEAALLQGLKKSRSRTFGSNF